MNALTGCNLERVLVEMADEDQHVLNQLFETGELPSEQYHPAMRAVHERNAGRLRSIIEEQGWPDRLTAGEKGAEAAWLIAQHSVSDLPFMQECARLMEGSVASGRIEGWQLAFLRDRICTLSGQKQIYGTQFEVDENGWPIPFAIDDPENVNLRRSAVGLNTIEDRISEMLAQETKRRNSMLKPSAGEAV
ncbi:UNVERIFIED_CONTAM: hypothetical protein P3D01_20410 [Pseudomonas aeruginosa]|uniref:DUF6624 domain-containing protein n=1 Tax=Pseudomonas aeruginosa TaxID=287 RepID=UPI001C96F741|nr:DUF6624 domain-containing protein [Pseudomonas aeruginosa]